MVIDTSAVVAILFDEPEAERFRLALDSAKSLMISAASVLEVSLVVESRREPTPPLHWIREMPVNPLFSQISIRRAEPFAFFPGLLRCSPPLLRSAPRGT